ncbi:hypothetical protein [Aeromicrobium sp. CnD17-E]|uniref:hypothetical protein n=1 Tax=Aeromicrobium sp. CnD17-E TaxID=2954487 RepID=UPI0020969006|nr:hypothetical protein [Aeromicrobium sp. CnD17-E]MCO7238796.1 hypothetical protein [Aeromicrobium sp. CnD17-E]
MPLPITVPQFASDLDVAKAYLNTAASEAHPAKQQALAMIALAAAQIANAEAQWLTGNR